MAIFCYNIDINYARSIAMNQLATDKRTQIISAHCEGASINATCRMTGVAKHTVLKLLKDMGCACASYDDTRVLAGSPDPDHITSQLHSWSAAISRYEWGCVVSRARQTALVRNWKTTGIWLPCISCTTTSADSTRHYVLHPRWKRV